MHDAVSSIFHLRCLWSHAVIAQDLARGRDLGYLEGTSDHMVDPVAVEQAIRELDLPRDATPMGRLADRHALNAREEAALWLLACCELEADLARFVERVAARDMQQLGVQDLLRMVGISLAELERLFELALIELETSRRTPIHRRRVRATDRILELAGAGDDALDKRLAGIAHLTSASRPTRPALVEGDDKVLVVVVGPPAADRDEFVVASVATPLLCVSCARLSDDEDARWEQMRAIAREARLFDATLLLSGADRVMSDERFARMISRMPTATYATATAAPFAVGDLPIVVHEAPRADRPARAAAWRRALPGAAEDTVEAAADRYRLPAQVIADVGRSLRVGRVAPTIDDVQAALRQRLDRRLAGFATRVSWRQQWEDLVLPPDQCDLLVELLARVQHRHQVIESWGFGAKIGKGTGTTALLSGPPGTGKTMIAGLLAAELGLDLYQADLSKIVSKYIGETEQRLADLFDAAEHGQAIILFDEADALFGKRTEVRSSNDRYANLETNYLLQRLESFDGVCILTTNHESAIDAAFLRRLSTHVRVPMPDEEHRVKLWRAMLPAEAAIAGAIDFDGLGAQFVMSGGYIKNAVVRAAYLAAAEEEPIHNHHLWRAARAEYEALGKLSRP